MFLQCVHECTCVCKITVRRQHLKHFSPLRVGPSYRYSVPSMFDYCYFSYLNRRKISKLECFSISPSAGLSLPRGGGHLHRSPQPRFPAELRWSPEETVVRLAAVWSSPGGKPQPSAASQSSGAQGDTGDSPEELRWVGCHHPARGCYLSQMGAELWKYYKSVNDPTAPSPTPVA